MTPHDRMRWDAARRDLAAAIDQLSQEVRSRDRTKRTNMSFTGLRPGDIQAAIAQTQRTAQERIDAAMQTFQKAALRATTAVPAAIESYAAKVEKETDAQLHEFAKWTNGAPDDIEEPLAAGQATPLPTVAFSTGMVALSEIPAALKGRGNSECVPIGCGCGETFLFPAGRGRTVTCPACNFEQTFAADDASFNVIHNGQAK
jgi:hypothetical protein